MLGTEDGARKYSNRWLIPWKTRRIENRAAQNPAQKVQELTRKGQPINSGNRDFLQDSRECASMQMAEAGPQGFEP